MLHDVVFFIFLETLGPQLLVDIVFQQRERMVQVLLDVGFKKKKQNIYYRLL